MRIVFLHSCSLDNESSHSHAAIDSINVIVFCQNLRTSYICTVRFTGYLYIWLQLAIKACTCVVVSLHNFGCICHVLLLT